MTTTRWVVSGPAGEKNVLLTVAGLLPAHKLFSGLPPNPITLKRDVASPHFVATLPIFCFECDVGAAIIDGVPHRQIVIDRAIAAGLSTSWRLQRIDSILRAILRAAAYELVDRRDIPARVVMDEYIEIARRFSDEEQCAFVNAVLDRIAHVERAAEFASAPDDGG